MDYLDPKKRFRQTVLLISGYILIAIAIIMATIVLLYQAYGFGLGKNGTIIQNGLLFFSSQPNPASIYINGQLNNSTTNTRLTLPAGVYQVKIEKNGYRTWQRTIEVDGGSVEHFDYPFLFPTQLITKRLSSYSSAPGVLSQSPSQQYLLVQKPDVADSFDLYNLANPQKVTTAPSPTTITIPSTVVSTADSSESWQVIAWSDDNQHVLLQHTYDGKVEYILLDTTDPSQSVNLSTLLASDPFTQITLENDKYDQYVLYNGADQSLSTVTLKDPTEVPVASHVLAYQMYGTNTLLYVTSYGASAGKVLVKEEVGTQNYTIMSLPDNTTYLLDLTQYSGTPYVAVGATSDGKVYIYDNPVGQLQTLPDHVPVPTWVLRVANPNYLSFSTNAQFIVAEGGQQFGVYDIENAHGYEYATKQPLDTPQLHASWMDGDRLMYVSSGKLVVFDYDHANFQTLMPADAAYVPAFSPDFDYMYALAPGSGTSANLTYLTQTSTLIPSDQ